MKKLIAISFSLGLAFSFSFTTAETVDAKVKVKTYKNCTELNKVHKGGVAKSSKVKNKGGKTKYKPIVSAALYNANKKSDRDNDGIACER